MVDPINGIGSAQGPNKTQNSQGNQRREEAREARESGAPRDEVSISQEAIDLAQAERATVEVRHALENDSSETLGLNPSFDEDI